MISYIKTLKTNALSLVIIFSFTLVLTGCELLPRSLQKDQQYTFSYSHYYLWLKTLSKEELNQEITRLNKSIQLSNTSNEGDYEDTQTKLLLAKCLPSSPIYNPYSAKAELNKFPMQLDEHVATDHNLAFMVSLKDQLNQHLLLLQKIEQLESTLANTNQKINLVKVLLAVNVLLLLALL